ncbi:kinesin light chain 1 and, putative [Rhizoctonia solani AG-1 IA]|uniref:Kinesin light chain 1 and, putative n=1 Tax=Thanatephorus cucumeris (strain AG1-IA) TaxID=983506 RepID=L8X4X7_THACA|nr:kinesin light chain 1 and, putative [Rhizoctonia solani AG-1 IA]
MDYYLAEGLVQTIPMARPATLTKSEMASMRSSVEALRKQRRWTDMAELQTKMLRSNEQTLGNEHPDTLALMHDLAITYSNGKNPRNAAQIFQPLYNTRRKLLGPEHKTTLTTMHYLAATYTDLGRLNEAQALHRELLLIRRRLLGNDNVETLRTMQYLAVTCGNMGQLTHARDLYEEMLPIRRRKLGEEHDATVLVMSNLAVTYTDLRQFIEAEALHREVLTIRRRLKGEENTETIQTMHYLAVTYGGMGRLADSAEWHARVLPLRKRLLGPDNTTTVVTMAHLATAYTDLGRFHEAEDLHVQLLRIRKHKNGIEHKDTLQTAYYLIHVYVGLKKSREAETLLLEMLPIFDRVHGKTHAHSLTGLSHLASIYEQSGHWNDAERYEKELFERRKQFHGETHPDTLASMKSLSIIYQNQRRWGEVDLIEEAITSLNPGLSGSAAQTLWYTAPTTLPISYGRLGTTPEPISPTQSIETVTLSKFLGSDQPESIASLEIDAISLVEQERWAEAESALANVLVRRRRVQGDGHPFTIRTASNLASLYQSQSKYDEAVNVLQTALTRLGQSPGAASEDSRAEIDSRLSALRKGQKILLETPQIPGTSEDILAYLTNIRCPDLTQSLDEASCGGPIQDGGFGEICQGRLNDGRVVALKSLREINRKRLKHDNVLELFGLAYLRGGIVMVSPWMEFGNLRDYLKQNRSANRLSMVQVPPAYCAELFSNIYYTKMVQITEGIDYLHNIPMIHGDIKAANIFVSKEGIAKIGDFGTSTFQGEQSVGFSSTSNPNLVGTMRWMAPEMFHSNSAHTREADIYALGMYDHDIQVIRAVALGTKPTCPPELIRQPKLWTLLNKCWDLVPHERPTAKHILSEVYWNLQEIITSTLGLWSDCQSKHWIKLGARRSMAMTFVSRAGRPS